MGRAAGKGGGERRPLALGALDSEGAAVQIHEVGGEGEADARPLLLAG